MTVLRDTILLMAYKRSDHNSAMIFDAVTTCSECNCEYMFILKEEQKQRTLSCQNCGNIFQPAEVAG